MSNTTTDEANEVKALLRSFTPLKMSENLSNEYKVLFTSSDSWNYTFHSMGSLGTILLLNFITSYTCDKSSVLLIYSFQFTSLIGIIYISNKYFDNYIMNFQRLSSQHIKSFGI